MPSLRIFRWPIESCVMSAERFWSWTVFNSWSSIALGIAFDIHLSDNRSWPQKQKCALGESGEKNALRSGMNSAFVTRYLKLGRFETHILFSICGKYACEWKKDCQSADRKTHPYKLEVRKSYVVVTKIMTWVKSVKLEQSHLGRKY